MQPKLAEAQPESAAMLRLRIVHQALLTADSHSAESQNLQEGIYLLSGSKSEHMLELTSAGAYARAYICSRLTSSTWTLHASQISHLNSMHHAAIHKPWLRQC